MENLTCSMSMTSAHKGVGGRDRRWVTLKNGQSSPEMDYRAIMAPLWLISKKTHSKHLAKCMRPMHPITTGSLDARPLTRPDTTIQASCTSHKRRLLEPSLSSLRIWICTSSMVVSLALSLALVWPSPVTDCYPRPFLMARLTRVVIINLV